LKAIAGSTASLSSLATAIGVRHGQTVLLIFFRKNNLKMLVGGDFRFRRERNGQEARREKRTDLVLFAYRLTKICHRTKAYGNQRCVKDEPWPPCPAFTIKASSKVCFRVCALDHGDCLTVGSYVFDERLEATM
jgi:hypothetical protein